MSNTKYLLWNSRIETSLSQVHKIKSDQIVPFLNPLKTANSMNVLLQSEYMKGILGR